ncbi:MAG: M64 family metallopeptidase [Verrucomicrobiota bacterium]
MRPFTIKNILFCAAFGLALASVSSFAQVKTALLTNGPPSKRINLTVLSEGYQSAEAAQFLIDAQGVVDFFFAAEPYREYRSYFNASAVFVASVDSGSDHPVNQSVKNTYFNSSYDLTDAFVSIPFDMTGLGKVNSLIQSLAPETDLTLLVVNDTVFGGAGGPIIITSKNVESPEIVVHEAGHTLGGLADEYSDFFPGFADIEKPNTTQETNRNLIKWKAWISPATPIPTPPTAEHANEIGLFEGAQYHTNGWYRPKLDCKMRTLGKPFCEVCTEALVKAMSQKVRLAESFSPAATELSAAAGSFHFEISPLKPATHDLTVQWFTNGVAVEGATQTNFDLSAIPATVKNYFVRAEIRDPTPWVRVDPANSLSNSVSWHISKSMALPAPFEAFKGKYTGLFFETPEARLVSSGLFNLNLSARGNFSGKLVMAEATFSFKGIFDLSNSASVIISRRGKSSLTLSLDLDRDQEQIRGVITSPDWSAELKANRDGVEALAAKYTFIIPAPFATNAPLFGDGFGTAVLSANGAARVAGKLSEGTAFQSRLKTSNGEFPLFVRFFGGHGMLLGWLNFSANNINAPTAIWIKDSGAPGKYYPAGFTNQVSISGDRYDAPAPGQPPVIWTNAALIFEGSASSIPSTNLFALNGNRVVFPAIDKLSLAISSANGLFKGKFFQPETQKTIPFQGAVLQKRNSGSGFFLSPPESGRVSIQQSNN